MAVVLDEGVCAVVEDGETGARSVCSVLEPVRQTVPLVFASPHSGQDYPEAFVSEARLDPTTLRRSEDAFVDEIFQSAVTVGAPLLRAHFPRAYVDPNREPYELDAGMFDEPLPDFVNVSSPRVVAGLGTIARVVTSGEEIYRRKLTFGEARKRIETFYFPYHQKLKSLIDRTRAQFGFCVLIDCHSMPSIGGPMDSDSGAKRVDIVLGDRYGSSCAAAVIDMAERALCDMEMSVRRNVPYAGGFTTRHYGRPADGVHGLQIEINRALYMDEQRVVPGPGFDMVKDRINRLIDVLARVSAEDVRIR